MNLRLLFTIQRTGKVSTAVVTGASDSKVKRCVTRWLSKLRFPSFSGKSMKVTYPLRL